MLVVQIIRTRKEKVIIIAGSSFSNKQEKRASLSKEQRRLCRTRMPRHVTGMKGKIISILFVFG